MRWFAPHKAVADRLPRVTIGEVDRSWLNNPALEGVNIPYTLQDDNGAISNRELYVEIARTPCNFGGSRCWFICPMVNCSRRVGVLYCLRGVWACRVCHNLCYDSQNEYKRMQDLARDFILQRKIENLEKRIKRRYYNGRPTRLQRKFEYLLSLPY